MFVFPPDAYVEILTSKVLVLGGGVIGRWLGHEGGALLSEISALIKETPESSLAPSTMWGHSEKTALCEWGSKSSPGYESAGALILDFQSPEVWEINFCCF